MLVVGGEENFGHILVLRAFDFPQVGTGTMTDVNLDMPEVTQEEKMTKDFSEETEVRIADARKIAKACPGVPCARIGAGSFRVVPQCVAMQPPDAF